MSLGARLRERRELKKKTQIEASNDLGISNVQLSRYESDERKPEPELLARFAEYYNTSSDYLLGMTNDPTPITEQRNNQQSIRIGRAYYGGGDDWTEEERALADAFIKTLRERKKAEKEE